MSVSDLHVISYHSLSYLLISVREIDASPPDSGGEFSTTQVISKLFSGLSHPHKSASEVSEESWLNRLAGDGDGAQYSKRQVRGIGSLVDV